MEAITEKITNILGEVNGKWTISDKDEENSIYLITQENSQGNIMTTIVDTEEDRVILKYGHIDTQVVANSIEKNTQGYVADKEQITSGSVNCSIYKGYNGPVLKVFKYKGKIYTTSKKKLSIENVRWGRSQSFSDLLKEAGLGDVSQLYSKEIESPSVCHTFILVHPETVFATLEKIPEKGYVVYLGTNTMDYYRGSWSDMPENEEVEDPCLLFKNIKRNKRISVEKANAFLQKGHYPDLEDISTDVRFGHGEFIVICCEDEDRDRIAEIHSPAYNFRFNLTDQNVWEYELIKNLSVAAGCGDPQKYRETFPEIACVSLEDVKEWIDQNGQMTRPDYWKLLEEKGQIEIYDLVTNTVLVFLLSIPLHAQKQVVAHWFNLPNRKHHMESVIKRVITEFGSRRMEMYKQVKYMVNIVKSGYKILIKKGEETMEEFISDKVETMDEIQFHRMYMTFIKNEKRMWSFLRGEWGPKTLSPQVRGRGRGRGRRNLH